MPDPAIIKPAIQYAIRGAFSLVADEVRGAYRRKNAPERAEVADFGHLDDLPSLDDARLGDSFASPENVEPETPGDLFGVVVGLEYEKKVLRRVVASDVPLHALLIGPPGSAKSLLLEELRRLPDTRYIVGRNMSSAGLLEMVMDKDSPPRIILIDEIEKSDPTTLATLLTVMDGKATRAIHGKGAVEEEIDVRVVAAGNSTKNMPDSLLSRFIELELQAITPAEREEVIKGFLIGRQGMTEADAKEIAGLIAPRGGDTRDAVQIASVWGKDQELAREMVGRLGTGDGSASRSASRTAAKRVPG